jgi:hypothetical protein
MRLAFRLLAFSVCLLLIFWKSGCTPAVPETPAQPSGPAWFEPVPAAKSGFSFANTLTDTDTLNILNYLYYYNGAGVATADFDGDSLPEVVWVGNQTGPQLYKNMGGLVFEDRTAASGLLEGKGPNPWYTGISVADVNADGLPDLYLCRVGAYLNLKGRNQLFINQGNLQFLEAAAEWGIDHEGFSNQAAFFDYDLDGDLDMYLLCHSVHSAASFQDIGVRTKKDPKAGDRLFRNEGNRFTDVTEAAGIYSSALGYGLGIAVSDFDRNGWPDLYISNDFHENDYLYLNTGKGSFRETISERVGHTSRFSMGSDVADVNQDGWPDLITLDMMPREEAIFKTAEAPEAFDAYQYKLRFGFHHQYPRNCLQINRGDGYFYEAGFITGLYATDWSWSALFQDYDLDGRTDVFISNGIYRRPNDLDYINFISSEETKRVLGEGMKQEDLEFVKKMPQVRVGSYLFRNGGNLAFENVSPGSGVEKPAFSNGSAYADLDLDGDMDLLVNNINEPAFLLKNLAADSGKAGVRVRLAGEGKNTLGIGATVTLRTAAGIQRREQYLSRGFLSSVDPIMGFGMGENDTATLEVRWPNGKKETRLVHAGQTVTLRQAEATYSAEPDQPASGHGIGWDDLAAPDFTHREDAFNDQNREPLIPWLMSREGPALAAADVNGDGHTDVFVGGGKGQSSALFFMQANGRFLQGDSAVWRTSFSAEDVAAAFFDADQDADLDLVVAPGGNEFPEKSAIQQVRLYLNDGKGNFSRSGAFSGKGIQASCVVAADFNDDGKMDLFVGARSVPGEYGVFPASHVYMGTGAGRFEEVGEKVLPEKGRLGMITAAAWAELDGKTGGELAVTGEWMAPRVLKPGPQGWSELNTGLEAHTGFWRSLLAADLDGDGDMDLVAGNLGLNTYLRASEKQPIRLFIKDFDENGALDPILTMYKEDGKSYPLASRDELFRQLPHLRKGYASYAAFGPKNYEQIFTGPEREGALNRAVTTLAHMWFENDGQGRFVPHQLPLETQITPVNTLWHRPGVLVLGGNFFSTGALIGRLDASAVSMLNGDPSGWVRQPVSFAPFWAAEVRAMVPLWEGKIPALLVGVNQGKLRAVEVVW